MYRAATTTAALLALTVVAAAEDPVRIELTASEDWGRERIELPPSFAPQMELKGTEEIRFAPGMFRADSDSFFSYVIVFHLPARKPLDEQTLQRELLAYYRGLAQAVARGKNLTVQSDGYSLTIERIKPGETEGPPALTHFTGELKWDEPFVTGKPQTLRLEIEAGPVSDSDASYVAICVSPQSPDAAIWTKLREVRKSARFTSGRN
jgi:hypothetical protein